ncbi:MAG: PIN domain-containing protein [Elusimicrobia bacterium]|nr:PIN domain-containing protein [Elusimicrobiota bacterium]
MRPKVFVDTSAWYALVDSDDTHHQSAWQVLPQLLSRFGGLVTSNHVIGESYTLIRSCLGHRKAWEFLGLLERSHRLERVFTPEALETEAYALLKKHPDQDFSFVDATSFVWMRILKLRDAFAFDKHFQVLGFILHRNT